MASSTITSAPVRPADCDDGGAVEAGPVEPARVDDLDLDPLVAASCSAIASTRCRVWPQATTVTSRPVRATRAEPSGTTWSYPAGGSGPESFEQPEVVDDEDRVAGEHRGVEHADVVSRRRRRRDPPAWEEREQGSGIAAVLRAVAPPPGDLRPDDDRHLLGSPVHVAGPGNVVEQLVGGLEGEVRIHELDDRVHPGKGRAERGSGEPVLADRRGEDPFGGDRERRLREAGHAAAEVPDLLAQDERLGVALEAPTDDARDGSGVGDLGRVGRRVGIEPFRRDRAGSPGPRMPSSAVSGDGKRSSGMRTPSGVCSTRASTDRATTSAACGLDLLDLGGRERTRLDEAPGKHHGRIKQPPTLAPPRACGT